MGKVCFNQSCVSTTTFFAFMFVAFGIMAYTLYYSQMSLIKEQQQQQPVTENTGPSVVDQALLQDAAIRSTRVRDIDRLVNPLVPPTRRSGFGMPPSSVAAPINVPTRGEYGPFEMMGYLQNAAGDKVLRLMGRRIHSNQFEYYTFHPVNDEIKMPLEQSRELFEGDSITVDQFGDFKVFLYDQDVPRYVPY